MAKKKQVQAPKKTKALATRTEEPKKPGAINMAGTAMQNFKGNELAGADLFDVDDNIKGVKGRLPQIKIAHQVQMFTDATGTAFKDFKGVILHHTASNAWWEKSFDETGGGEIPECFSMDGCTPDGEKLQAKNCMECPKNAFKSARDGGRGKDCKNMWRLHILVDGQIIPKRLTLPPSNLGAIQEFLVGLRDRNIPHELAVINFTLKPAKNKDGIGYSSISFELQSVITNRETALELKKIKDSFAASFGQAIMADEMESAE